MSKSSNFFLVFLGGGLGTVLRYATNLFFTINSFPLPTLISNGLASLIFGFLMGLMLLSGISREIFLFLGVGLCGGWSTFSSFTMETYNLMEEKKIWVALLNVSGNLLLSILLLMAGIWMARNI